MGIREDIASDLHETVESDFGLPVELISPAGVRQTMSAYDPESLLMGQILYDTIKQDSITGGDIITHKPVVTLVRSSLDTIPSMDPTDGNWAARIPLTPDASAPKVTLRASRVPAGGNSIGFIVLHLEKIVQEA